MEGEPDALDRAGALLFGNPSLDTQIDEPFPLLEAHDVVNEVVVDAIGAQPIELYAEEAIEILERRARPVRKLGGNVHAAAQAVLLDDGAEHLFAAPVQIGRVEVVDALAHRIEHERFGLVSVDATQRREGEAHAAVPEGRQPSSASRVDPILHGASPPSKISYMM